MPALWQTADVSLVLLRDTPLFRTVIPSKIFESLAMQTPIVLGVAGESRQLIESSGAGVAITPGNAAELAAKVLELSRTRPQVKEMGVRGAAFVREHFDRAKLARRYADVLQLRSSQNVLQRSVELATHSGHSTASFVANSRFGASNCPVILSRQPIWGKIIGGTT